jgi:hypothetical protein
MSQRLSPLIVPDWLLVALLTLSHWQAFGAALPLATNSKPAAVIVTAENGGALTRLAVSELQSYLEQLSGARLPVAEESQLAARSATEPVLLVGNAEQSRLLRELVADRMIKISGLKKEGFVIRTLTWKERPLVAVVGVDEAGALYGAYELLERLGITFRLTGDFVPGRQATNRLGDGQAFAELAAPNRDLSVPDLDLRMEPAMRRRGFLFSANFDNASTFSYPDYERLLDQMARMKCNYLQFWWFAYAPWLNFAYKGENKLMGDISTKESGYHSWYYGGFGSRTVEDVSIGREHFKDRARLAPLEMQKIETPEQAYPIARDMLQRIIAHAAKRNIKVWLAVELGSLPPNLARYAEVVGPEPFHYLFGTFVHPLDPVNREIQVSRLQALAQTYQQAEGFFLNLSELYPELANDKHREFLERERPRFHELRPLSVPWAAALANIYDVKWDRLVDSNIGFLDLFSYLLKKRDEVAPGMKLGMMTVGRGYALPLFNKMIPPEVPFSSLESGGVWTMMGVPMEYFGGMGDRERIIQPRVDDDFDMLGMQFSVRQYAEKDRIFVDGVKYGLSGVAGQLDRARGTEFNSSFLARACWQPSLTTEQFYRDSAERMFGPAAAEEMYQAFIKLEEHQSYLGYYEYDGGYGILLCCSGIREVNAAYQYWRQRNPFTGPVVGSWKRLISATGDFIAQREGSIKLLNEALVHMRAAEPKVAPQGRYELAYLINRTETFRDFFAGLNSFRRGMVSFDEAFRAHDELDHEAFVSKLEASLTTLREGREQLKNATTEYSQMIDHVSDLAVLYNINARVLLGTDLAIQLLENVVHYHEGKPYLRRVPFERLLPPKPDEGTAN